MPLIQRPGIDHDPIRPFSTWADMPLREEPVEVVSYPIPAEGSGGTIDEGATIMVRMTVGDPTSIKEVPLKHLACFDRTRHEWWYRPKSFYGDNPTAFVFTDDGEKSE